MSLERRRIKKKCNGAKDYLMKEIYTSLKKLIFSKRDLTSIIPTQQRLEILINNKSNA